MHWQRFTHYLQQNHRFTQNKPPRLRVYRRKYTQSLSNESGSEHFASFICFSIIVGWLTDFLDVSLEVLARLPKTLLATFWHKILFTFKQSLVIHLIKRRFTEKRPLLQNRSNCKFKIQAQTYWTERCSSKAKNVQHLQSTCRRTLRANCTVHTLHVLKFRITTSTTVTVIVKWRL